MLLCEPGVGTTQCLLFQSIWCVGTVTWHICGQFSVTFYGNANRIFTSHMQHGYHRRQDLTEICLLTCHVTQLADTKTLYCAYTL